MKFTTFPHKLIYDYENLRNASFAKLKLRNGLYSNDLYDKLECTVKQLPYDVMTDNEPLRTKLLSGCSDLGITVLEMPPKMRGNNYRIFYGWGNATTRKIHLNPNTPFGLITQTLVHEMAHVLLHNKKMAKNIKELEAQSVAYLVLQHNNTPLLNWSSDYVTERFRSPDRLMSSFNKSEFRILKAAGTILMYGGT